MITAEQVRKYLKLAAKYVGLPILIVCILVLSSLHIYRGYLQQKTLDQTRITSPNGIDSLEKVTLGGIEQWILIRGHDKSNPVLLLLHGGPGVASMAFHRSFHTELEEHFTVVHWDQRGAGKSFDPDILPASMTVEQFISDTRELVELLRKRFNTPKVYVVGHSWGSEMGTLAVSRHPELFYAYVGVGQVVDSAENEIVSYEFTVDKAMELGNEQAIRELEEIGPPPHDPERLMIQREWLEEFGGVHHSPRASNANLLKLGLTSPDYSLGDWLKFYRGIFFSLEHMWEQINDDNHFFIEVPRIEVPVYFFLGRYDYNTPFEITERYYQALDAPAGKQIVWFENSGHMIPYEEPEKYVDTLVNKVLKETYRNLEIDADINRAEQDGAFPADSFLATGENPDTNDKKGQSTPIHAQTKDGNAVEGIYVLDLEGTSRERGQKHGEALKPVIQEYINRWKAEIEESAGMDPDEYISCLVEYTGYLAAAEKWTPDVLEEVRGIAEGSGIDFKTIFAYQLGDEEPVYRREQNGAGAGDGGTHCSAVGVFEQENGPTLLAQNMDVPRSLDGSQVLLRIKDPTSPVEALVFSIAGCIALNGINTGPIGICCNTLSQLDHSTDGLPVAFIVRGVLAQATLEEAVAFIHRIKHASGQNYLIGGPEKILDFECSAGQVSQFIPSSEVGHIYHTNHPLVNDDRDTYGERWGEMSMIDKAFYKLYEMNSGTRLRSIKKDLSNASDVVTKEEIKSILSSVCFHGRWYTAGFFTLGCTIMELSPSPTLHIAPGPPSSTKFTTHELGGER